MAPRTLQEKGGNAAFPKQQLFILALCRICEPIAFMSIFPYIYYMVDSFKMTNDNSRIAVYAGMVTSAFAFAEFSTGLVWGRLSDKVGRKPVLLTGLAGTALSMLLFGFAPNLPVALLARALGGLLNGNIGVLQTTVAEMITVKEHQPRAYTIMPFVWCLGSILGPTIGGALAEPCKSYPSLFATGTIFERFPYLLPNLVCTVILAIGVVIGVLFLEETHAEKKHRRDVGIEVGNWLLTKMRRCTRKSSARREFALYEETQSLIMEDEQPPGYRTTDGSPQLPVATPSSEPHEPLSLNSSVEIGHGYGEAVVPSKPAARKAFTKQVVLNIIGYGILAYHTMTLDQMMPVLLSTPDTRTPHELPFKFVGGFGLPTKQVGIILSMQGLYSMVAQIFLFPFVVRHLGELKTFRLIAISYPVLYFTVPYLVLLPDSLRLIGVYGVLIWKITFAVLAYPANAILLTNSAPSLLLLGTINGVAASTASLSRAFGPTVSGLLYTAGLKLGYSGLAWWCSSLVAILGAVLSMYMSDVGGRMSEKVDGGDQEAAYLDHALDHTALEQAIEAADLMLDRPLEITRSPSAIPLQDYEEGKAR